MNASAFFRAAPGEVICGDAGAYWQRDGVMILALVDGLGHGPLAADAAQKAMHFVEHEWTPDVSALFGRCNEVLARTRGAAAAVAVIDPAKLTLTFAGVGNVKAAILDDAVRLLASDPGIVGGGFSRVTTQSLGLSAGSTVVLWTDGIQGHVAFDEMPQYIRANPEAVCAHLAGRYASERDDVGIVCGALGDHP